MKYLYFLALLWAAPAMAQDVHTALVTSYCYEYIRDTDTLRKVSCIGDLAFDWTSNDDKLAIEPVPSGQMILQVWDRDGVLRTADETPLSELPVYRQTTILVKAIGSLDGAQLPDVVEASPETVTRLRGILCRYADMPGCV